MEECKNRRMRVKVLIYHSDEIVFYYTNKFSIKIK